MLSLIWTSMRQEMARKRKGARVEDISLTDLLRIILSPDSSREMKRLLAKQFQQSDGLLAAMGASGFGRDASVGLGKFDVAGGDEAEVEVIKTGAWWKSMTMLTWSRK